ncbi:unnamed protein product [Litomosoides sigmodontis]|uniref:Uncharacterized protein n=1 Tax=Litomosoides sigmodontis TaxID=42156 RepID=A0A3P6VAF0_LITSI|nr:unnamed protein product [Litomosoides sigmodontis]
MNDGRQDIDMAWHGMTWYGMVWYCAWDSMALEIALTIVVIVEKCEEVKVLAYEGVQHQSFLMSILL